VRDALRNPPAKKENPEQFNITPHVKKLLLEKYAPHIYKIKSKDTGNEYCISLVKNHFTCSCNSFQFRSKNSDGSTKTGKSAYFCKHQKLLALELLEVKQ